MQLTALQLQVLGYLCEGKGVAEIACLLNNQVVDTEKYIFRLLKKINVKRAEDLPVWFHKNQFNCEVIDFCGLNIEIVYSKIPALTKTEAEVLGLMLQGKYYKDISGCLWRSISTINSHAQSILRKARCKRRYELIRLCR